VSHRTLVAALAAIATLSLSTGAAGAATSQTTFAGTITSTMSVNDGTNTGSIPAGTPYTGTLTYDGAQTPAPAAYGGGTHTVYTFDNLAFTIGTSTANSGPGRIDVYDDLTTSTSYPTGDSVYVNFAGVAPSGLLAGAAFNWMGLALLDRTGAAVTGGALPADLEGASFGTRFSEFNFGTRGTKWGAGNTSTIQSLTSLTTAGTQPPPPAPIAFSPSLPDGTAGVAYSASFAAATGGTGSFTYDATGLPAGLSLSGTTVSGTPTATGTFDVTLTATDAAGASSSHTVALTIADQPIAFAPSLPAGTVGSPYSARLSASGFGPFTFDAQGLPAGLSLSGDTISGTPTAAGSFPVVLTATDAAGVTRSAQVTLTVAAGGNYTIKDESRGKITAIDLDAGYLMVGTKKLIWNASTTIIVNTPDGERHVIDGFVKVGMKVQWKGLRDRATNTVLTSQIEVN
jgi:hypothetical protein